MRCCYCSGTLTEVQGQYKVQAQGLQLPMTLLFGSDRPDLSPILGKLVFLTGNLEAPGTNQEELNVSVFDLQETPSDAAATPVFGVFSGNIGKTAELSPNSQNGVQRLTSSIAYYTQNGQTSWLRLSALSNDAIFNEFSSLQAGSRIICTGTLSHYTYNKKTRLELALRTFDLDAQTSYKAPEKYYTAASASGASPESTPGF